jgi:RNA polymerase sigma-70 factor (ECF subfamily)
MATCPTIQRVIDQHADRVFTLACYTLGSRQDAEDVTQEVLLRYWKHADGVDPDKVEGWLVRVTTNACRDLMRRRSRRREVIGGEACDAALDETPCGELTPEATLEASEKTLEMQQLLLRLKEPYRSVVVLREVQSLSYLEIAEAMEMTLANVRVTLHRGRRQLAEIVANREAANDLCRAD